MTELAVGLLLPTREAFVRGDLDPRPLLALADAASELGFDSVWASYSPLARPRWEPLTLLSAVAGRSDLTLGTAVLLAALRHPVMLAHTVATLDRLARGRLILGVGAGFPLPQTEAEFEALGVPHRKRFGRLAEQHGERMLELRDRPRNGGLRDVEALRCFPHAAGFHHGHKDV